MCIRDRDTVASSSDDNDYMIVPSRTQDKKKNPLDADTKVSVMQKMFPKHKDKIVNDKANRTIFDVLKKAHTDGYANVRILGGADRVKEFEKLTGNYNGKLYQFDNLEIKYGLAPIDLTLLATFAAPPNKNVLCNGLRTGTGLSGEILIDFVSSKISKKTSPKISIFFSINI